MNDLSEIIGHILCEVTRARMAADFESVRLAKLYASDPDGLLSSFPVPRMRLPTIELTLPVVVSQVPVGYTAAVSSEALATQLSNRFRDSLKQLSIQISLTEIQRVIKSDANLSQGFINAQSSQYLGQKLIETARLKVEKTNVKTNTAAKTKADKPNTHTTKAAARIPVIETMSTAERFKLISETIQTQVRQSIEALPQRPLGVSVDARTQQIKEVGEGSFCLNLKLNVSEEAMEMQFESVDDGNSTPPRLKRLAPE